MNRTFTHQRPDLGVQKCRLGLYAKLHARQPTLARWGSLFGALAVPTLLLSLIDHRQVLGVNTWIKPAKFFVSLAIYFFTLAWAFAFITPARREGRSARYVVRAAIATGVIEQSIITVRAALGQQSHFNVATFFDAFWYDVMAVAALFLVSSAVVLGVMVRRSQVLHGARLVGWSAGLVIGGIFGGLTGSMLGRGPTHFVGGPSTERMNVPFLGWSTTVGDLRIAHFFALHSMFVLPVIGALAYRRWGSARRGTVVTLVATIGWTIIVLGTLVNALAGKGI